MNDLFIYSFYRFKGLKNINQIKKTIDIFLKKKKIRGTILVAKEGINGSISGSKNELDNSLKFIKSVLNIRKLNMKVNYNKFHPFNRMKVRIKKEIVSLGKGNFNVNNLKGKSINPEEWNNIISEKNTKIIDVRNQFEIGIGRFSNSLNPKTNSFRDFPDAIKRMKIKKQDKIAMYCTGGIRCEKASSYLRLIGYKNVYQLNGGIINYLQYMKTKNKKTLWEGECFVFDDRVTIDKNLSKGKYIQCYGCRRPITMEDTKSNFYRKGVNCPYCYKERSIEQKHNSLIRQTQIDDAEKLKLNHPFKKNYKL